MILCSGDTVCSCRPRYGDKQQKGHPGKRRLPNGSRACHAQSLHLLATALQRPRFITFSCLPLGPRS
jgi:hypothetical protein